MKRVRPGLRQRMVRRHQGAVLLEAIVALTLIAIAGVSLLELTVQTTSAEAAARSRSEIVMEANAFLESVSMWPRVDLDRHQGRRQEGKLELLTERITPTLYHVVIGTSVSEGAPMKVLIETTFYRHAS